jgi:hypothetical protein
VNLDRLSMGEKLLAGSGLALFVLSFVGYWIKAEIEFGGNSVTERANAWDGYGFLLKLALVLALVAAILVIARAANVQMALPWANVYKGLAALTLLLVALTLVIGPEEAEGFEGVEISRGILLFVGTLLAALMAAGAWMHTEQPGPATTPATPA